MLTKEQEIKFNIICQEIIPEYILRKPEGSILDLVLASNEADRYIPLYEYGSGSLCFVLGRLHYYINNELKDLYIRVSEKNNRYLLSGSRSFFNSLSLIFEQIASFFIKNGISFEIKASYLTKINELNELIPLTAPDYILPNEYAPLCDFLIDEPIFSLTKRHTFKSAKNLIFGVSKKKPDIRLKQVIDGEIEVVNSDDMLVFDQEIGDSLLYKQFDEWWEDNKSKYSWYKVREQLQERELKVLNYYRKNYRDENNPVLIPQVYLHYDPKSKSERKNCTFNEDLIFQRMDFLMLYNGRRVIIEIDGNSHITSLGEADIVKYAKQLEYDRVMKFLGYEVFRIGNSELDTETWETTLKNFFDNLYLYLGIENTGDKNDEKKKCC